MNISQASTSISNSDNDPRLYLDDKDISFLFKLVEKSEDIFSVGQEKFEEIYRDIDYYCNHNLRIDSIGNSREIKKVEDIITKHKDIQEEVSERIVIGYITEKDQPRIFEELSKYREYLEKLGRIGRIVRYNPERPNN